MKRNKHVRDGILNCLAQAGGKWLSGERLATNFHVSRAAVGKHAMALRQEGHLIEAASGRGYRLISRADPWAGEDMASRLNTSCFGKGPWLWLKETDSTNLSVMREALAGGPDGLVAVARHQSQGRGQEGRVWTDMPGCLMFSVLLRQCMPEEGPEALLKTILKACQCAVQEHCGADIRCKAPNDLMLNGKKIGGVLIESMFRNNLPAWAVAGIGINVNVPAESFPEALRGTASSLYAETGRPFSLAALLAAILEKMERSLMPYEGKPA